MHRNEHAIRRFAITCTWFLCSCIPLFSQESTAGIIDNFQGDERIEKLYEYGLSLKGDEKEQLKDIAGLIVKFAKSSDSDLGYAYGHHLYIIYHNYRKDYGAVFRHSKKAIEHNCEDTLEACLMIRRTIARILTDIGRFEEALEHEAFILDYYKREKSLPNLYRTYSRLGDLYQKKGDKAAAFENYHKAIDVSLRMENGRIVRKAYNLIGLAFRRSGELDSAGFYFRKGIQTFEKQPMTKRADSLFYGLISGNLGHVYFLKKEYDKGRELLEIDLELNLALGGNASAFNALMLLVRIHLEKNQPQKALTYLLSAEGMLKNKMEPENRWLQMHELFVSTYQQLNNYQLADYHFRKFMHISDSLNEASLTVRNEMQQAFIDEIVHKEIQLQQIENERKEDEIKNLEQEKALGQYRIVSLVAGIVTILILSALYILRSRSNVRKRQEINRVKAQLIQAELEKKELEQSLLQEELGVKNNQLTNFALDLSRKHDFTNKLLERLKRLRRKATREMTDEVNELMIFARNELNIDNSLHQLQENISKIHFSFFESLEKKHPDLTKTEKYLCGLLRIELSNHEIAILREVSVDSVKVAKNRLRRKMNLEQRTNITKYLRSL